MSLFVKVFLIGLMMLYVFTLIIGGIGMHICQNRGYQSWSLEGCYNSQVIVEFEYQKGQK